MHTRIMAPAVIAVGLSGGQGLAWGYQGHEVVGFIADMMLTDHAKHEVQRNLGFLLRVVAPRADCVRSTVRHADGSFQYAPSRPEYRIPCTSFETPEETARMEDYVRRNRSACVYEDGRAGCAEGYHVADVSIQHDGYERTYTCTSNHDVVSAINAAIAVLKDQPARAPFSIRDKKEALSLLAHFVGDLHQPPYISIGMAPS
jgi:hypothetical protein